MAKVATDHFLGIAGFVSEIKIGAHESLCKGLCYKVGVRDDVTIAECTKSFGRDVGE